MKLKSFNAANSKMYSRGDENLAMVSFNQKAGVVRINEAAANKIGLASEDQIMIHQDEENPQDWYIEKVKENGFTLRAKDNDLKNGLLFNNTHVIKSIATSASFTDQSGKILLAGEATELDKGKRKLWGLLVVGLRNKI